MPRKVERHPQPQIRKKNEPSSSTMSSTGASSTSTAGEPKAPTTAEISLIFALEDRGPAPNYPLETSKALSYPSGKGETPALPNPRERKKTMFTPGDADIPEKHHGSAVGRPASLLCKADREQPSTRGYSVNA